MIWDVSGVAPSLRHRAEDAAGRAGMPLGAWLSETILSTILMQPEAPRTSPPPPPRRRFLQALRSGGAGFFLGAVIIVGAISGFVFVLDVENDATSRARMATDIPDSAPRTTGTDSPDDPNAARLSALRAAAGDDPAAQTELAALYLDGNGVTADPALAARLLEEAAVRGYADAQYRLALLYEDGRGRSKDAGLAAFWHDSAATRGSIPAAARLGVLYAEGSGVPQDYARAANWLRRAAVAGDPEAQFALGYLYRNGLGVAADADEARRWWTAAAEKGNADARAGLEGRDVAAPFRRPAPQSKAPPESASEGAATPAAVAEIQRLLKLLAFDPGATDGRVTTETTAAIRNYQSIAGLAPDGRPSAELLASLRAVAGTAAPR